MNWFKFKNPKYQYFEQRMTASAIGLTFAQYYAQFPPIPLAQSAVQP